MKSSQAVPAPRRAAGLAWPTLLCAALALAWGCGRSQPADPNGPATARFHPGTSQYRVRASGTEVMDLSGKGGAPGYDVKFDVTYRRTVARSQGSTGWEVRMAPVTGFASPLLGLPTRTPASEMGMVRLLFGKTGTLTKVVGLRAEDLGYNAFLPRVDFAPLLDLLVGTRPAPDALVNRP